MQRQSGHLDQIFCWNHLHHCTITSIVHLQVHGHRSCPCFHHTFTSASCFAWPFSSALNRASSSVIGWNLFQPTAASGGHHDCIDVLHCSKFLLVQQRKYKPLQRGLLLQLQNLWTNLLFFCEVSHLGVVNYAAHRLAYPEVATKKCVCKFRKRVHSWMNWQPLLVSLKC